MHKHCTTCTHTLDMEYLERTGQVSVIASNYTDTSTRLMSNTSFQSTAVNDESPYRLDLPEQLFVVHPLLIPGLIK